MTSYEISVRGLLDSGLLEELGVRSVEERPASTVLRAEVSDDSGLAEVLEQLSALGIEFLEARQVGDERTPS
jgi:hypothetical protein